jgi:hypothetical protein
VLEHFSADRGREMRETRSALRAIGRGARFQGRPVSGGGLGLDVLDLHPGELRRAHIEHAVRNA